MGALARRAIANEETAVRIYERGRTSAEQELERRTDANRPHRARGGMQLRLIDGGVA
jgi:hypothetical protein